MYHFRAYLQICGQIFLNSPAGVLGTRLWCPEDVEDSDDDQEDEEEDGATK